MAEGVRYIKIARIDGNNTDNTNTLQSLTKLTIPYSSGNVTYNILNITEYPKYFLYYVENPDIDWSNRGDVKYDFTGSIDDKDVYSNSLGIVSSATPIDFITGSVDNNNFYSINDFSYKLGTYPQKDLYLRASGSVTVTTTNALLGLYRWPSPQFDISTKVKLKEELISTGTNQTFDFNTSVSESLPGDRFFLGVRTNSITNTTNLEFSSSCRFFITSSNSLGSQLETIPEPYFTSNFNRAFDCQPLLNNVTRERSNPFLQDLDYTTSQTVPTNFIPVLNNNATKATVPESYYTSLAQTNIRYNGSINQSEKINQWTEEDNIGNYGKTPSIESLDTNIYEFEWGGGTTPEILGWSALKMGRILQVHTTESVRTINASEGLSSRIQPFPFYNPGGGVITSYRTLVGAGANAGVAPNNSTGSFTLESGFPSSSLITTYFWQISQSVSDYYYILNGNNPVNTEISPIMYPNPTAGSNPMLPKTTKIASTEFGVPLISNYALTSSNPTVYGTLKNSGGGHGFVDLDRSVHISKVTTDSNGYYQSAPSPIKPNWSTIGDLIVEDLNNNEKWFITVYNEFEFPNGQGDYGSVLTSGSLTPYNSGYNTLDSNGNYPNPLAYKGVYEIMGVYDNFWTGTQFQIILTTPIHGGTKDIGGAVAGNSLGMLIWKARKSNDTEFVIIQDEITGDMGAGAFTNRYLPQKITNNLDIITRKYGSNTQ